MSQKIFTSTFLRYALLPLFLLIFLFPLSGQDDARSKKIIDDMADKFKSYPSVFLNFSLSTTLLQGKPETEQEWKIWIKNNMYKLEIPDYVIYFDGSRIYQYMPEHHEVNIAKPDLDENDADFQMLNPLSFFHLSSKSFKTNFVKESVLNKRNVYEIDLYPIQIRTANYSRIRIMVEKTTLQLVYLKAFMIDGTNHALSFKPYEIQKTALRDAFFKFNHLEHPNVEVIDLTF